MTHLIGQSIQHSITVPLQADVTSYSVIDEIIPNPCILDSITYTSDIHFEKEEFDYLIDLEHEEAIDAIDIKNALIHLYKKNKFSSVDLSITIKNNRISIHMKLNSFWTFKNIKIKGLSSGREKYAQYYLLEPGELFDPTKHTASIEKIKQALRDQGYLKPTIAEQLDYDKDTKSVAVTLTISLGKIFKINFLSITTSSQSDLITKTVERVFSQRLQGKAYTQENIAQYSKGLKAALAQEGFLQTDLTLSEQVDESKCIVSLHVVVEAQQTKQLIFFGNHFFSEQQLLDTILSFGDAALKIPATLLSEEIQQAYTKKGFWNVAVSVKEEADAIFFVISEGKRILLKQVKLKGCDHFSEEQLINEFFPQIKKKLFYDADHIKQLGDSLIAWYQQQGFWDAEIISQSQTLIAQEAGKVVLHINEGNRYFIEKITIPGFPELEAQGPFVRTDPQPVPADLNQLSLQRRWLTDTLHKQGYLNVDIKPNVTVRPEENRFYVSVVWHIVKSDEKVRFGKTIVLGTPHVPFRYIQRQLNYQEGDLWDKEKLEKTLQDMRELELFEHIYLYPDQSVSRNKKQILMKLIEDDRFEIRLRGGVLGISKNLTWRDAATYKAGGSFLYKNPLYRGGLLRFDADLTRFERHISGFYSHPWLFGYPCRTTYKGYSNRYTQPIVIGSKDPLYVATQQGGLIGLRFKYKELTFGLYSGFEFQETILKSKAAAQAINFSPSLVCKPVPYIYVEPTIVLDYLNDKLTPTRGSFTVITMKGMFPTTHKVTTFLKVLIEESVFFTPIPPITLGFRFRCGHVFNQQFNQITPPERFFLGGPNTLRGYDLDFAPPLGKFIDCGKKKYVPQGGKTMINANFEIRFPVYKYISGALFQDAGLLVGDDVVSKFAQAVKNHGVAATGIGLRYNTPIGPLRFD